MSIRFVSGVRVLMAAWALPTLFCVAVFADASAPSAEYEVTFVATWSSSSHPISFPGGAHFSGLVGGTHHGGAVFWELGQLASAGIESMAETGSKTQLINEVNAEITAGNAGEVISGGGANSPGQVSTTFTATHTHSRATVVSMIAPSPDWFVGVNGLELFQNGQWVNEVVVQLQPYDAGTDSGTTYTSPNQNTNPPEPIFEIMGPPLSAGGPAAPLGTFTFTRTDGGECPTVPTMGEMGALVLMTALLGGGIAVIRRRQAYCPQ